MKPSECVPGAYVCYEPSPGHSFRGMIATLPWQIGEGTWVTKLVDMESRYGRFTEKKGEKRYTAFAACLESCVLIDQPSLIMYIPNSRDDQNEWNERYRNDPLFNHAVNVIAGNILAGEANSDFYRLVVECAVQQVQDHYIEKACKGGGTA